MLIILINYVNVYDERIDLNMIKEFDLTNKTLSDEFNLFDDVVEVLAKMIHDKSPMTLYRYCSTFLDEDSNNGFVAIESSTPGEHDKLIITSKDNAQAILAKPGTSIYYNFNRAVFDKLLKYHIIDSFPDMKLSYEQVNAIMSKVYSDEHSSDKEVATAVIDETSMIRNFLNQ